MAINHITIDGNLTKDPEIKFTSSGAAVCKFRIANTPRVKQGDQWVDGKTTFIDVECWRQLAENVTETVHKGQKVTVIGRLAVDEYTAKDGTQRTAYKIEAESVAVNLGKIPAFAATGGAAPVENGFTTEPW